jgi:peptidyl-prolyl cis-trans isomerase C
MSQIIRLFTALVATSALLLAPVALAQDAKSKAAPAKADALQKAGPLLAGYFDFMLKQRTAQGQPDTPELRTAVRDELNTRELLVREAKKQGLDKSPALKTEMDLTQQTVLVRAYMADYLKAHPVPEDALRKEYDAIKGQIGDKEYKVRHILVDKEDEAKEIIASLQKGEKFEKLADRSKDTGSKANGGDLDWNAPANFVKPFADAMVALPKGKFTTTRSNRNSAGTSSGRRHSRCKVPTFEEVKPQLAQRMQGQVVGKYLRDLRARTASKAPSDRCR